MPEMAKTAKRNAESVVPENLLPLYRLHAANQSATMAARSTRSRWRRAR